MKNTGGSGVHRSGGVVSSQFDWNYLWSFNFSTRHASWSPPPSFSLPHKKSTDSPGFSLVETEQNNSKYENKNNQQNDECSVRRDCTHPKKTTLLNTRKIGNKFKIIRP
eukprot:GEMP01031941.1.p1 GENE.GEMP01031941.1~~GEMP01031941.1.p1  ORF type:complete len:109 (-),score=1.62 GEMP01031941.1:1630-1956(-)